MRVGGEIGEATNLERGGLLVALDAPLFDDKQRIDVLFLATLSRLPTETERATRDSRVERLRSALDRDRRGDDSDDRHRAVASGHRRGVVSSPPDGRPMLHWLGRRCAGHAVARRASG